MDKKDLLSSIDFMKISNKKESEKRIKNKEKSRDNKTIEVFVLTFYLILSTIILVSIMVFLKSSFLAGVIFGLMLINFIFCLNISARIDYKYTGRI